MSAMLADIRLLKAHASAALTIAARLIAEEEKLQPVSTGRSKKNSGLSDSQRAQIQARMAKRQPARKTNRKKIK